MKRPRVLLADDHTLLLEALRKLLEPHFDIVGLAADGRAVISLAQRLKPQVVVLDISMPGLNGIDAARQLKKILPGVKLLFLTMHTDADYVAEAFAAGASGYLLKQSALSELPVAIHEAIKGGMYITPRLRRDVKISVVRSIKSKRYSITLTGRQREVLQLVAEGHSAKEIAAALHVSIKTVEFHKSRITLKLGLHTTAELTRYAIDHGIVGA